MGPTGPTGPPGTPGNPKSFTLYLDWSDSNNLSRVYVPNGFSTTIPGGIYTPSEDPYGIFVIPPTNPPSTQPTSQITIIDTTYAFPIDINCTGYTTSFYWSPTAQARIGGANITWQNPQDNTLILKDLTASQINGGNTGRRPESGVLEGWLGTVTIYYL